MRVGFDLPFQRANGGAPAVQDVMQRARLTEQVGFDGIWLGDTLGRPGLRWPDPLLWLLAASAATQRLELGTAVLQVPLRYPVELAHRLNTMHALTNGRFRAGLGTGSTQSDFDMVGVNFARRFKTLEEALPLMRGLLNGEQVGAANLRPWPDSVGGPPILVGVWLNEQWVHRAAQQFDGWLASSSRSLNDLARGIQRYRAAGGRRALLASINVDLAGPAGRLDPDERPFTLECAPGEARDRLMRVQDLGFDDVLLRCRNQTFTSTTEADLVRIRALHP